MTLMFNAFEPASEILPETYIVRVELIDAGEAQYAFLHSAMASAGFRRTIVSDEGDVFRLPSAEYVGRTRLSCLDLLDAVQAIAEFFRPNSHVLITRASEIAWSLPQIAQRHVA